MKAFSKEDVNMKTTNMNTIILGEESNSIMKIWYIMKKNIVKSTEIKLYQSISFSGKWRRYEEENEEMQYEGNLLTVWSEKEEEYFAYMICHICYMRVGENMTMPMKIMTVEEGLKMKNVTATEWVILLKMKAMKKQ